MPRPAKGPRLGGSPSHERIILGNLATQLFEHGRIVTTEAKAKRLRPLAEKLITKAKRGDIHARRTVLTTVRDKGVVHQLFTEIAPTFDGRDGGYTRITKVGPRKGDNAPMALIELVTEALASRSNGGRAAAPARTASARSAAQAAAGAAVSTASAAPSAQTVEPGDTEGVDTEAVSSLDNAATPAVDVDSPNAADLAPGAPAAEGLSSEHEVPSEVTQSAGEQLLSDSALQQETPSEAVPSDTVDVEDASAAPGSTAALNPEAPGPHGA